MHKRTHKQAHQLSADTEMPLGAKPPRQRHLRCQNRLSASAAGCSFASTASCPRSRAHPSTPRVQMLSAPWACLRRQISVGCLEGPVPIEPVAVQPLPFFPCCCRVCVWRAANVCSAPGVPACCWCWSPQTCCLLSHRRLLVLWKRKIKSSTK